MGFLVRAIRGKSDAVLRQASKLISQDPQIRLAAQRRYNVKPCQHRRRLRSQGKRRIDKASLMDNLRVVFNRKTRGF